MKRYLGRLILTVFDVLPNVLRAGRVETISSACGREIRAGQPCRFCSFICRQLDRFWPDHCINNIVTPIDKE